MNREYIQYGDNVVKYKGMQYSLILWWFLAVVFCIITVAAFIAVIPMGVILGIPCFFFVRFVVKKSRKFGAISKEIKAYKQTHGASNDLKADTTYCFIVPADTEETMTIIQRAMVPVGEVNSVDPIHSVVAGKIRTSSKKLRKVTFYVEKNDKECKVRACFYRLANDDWWDLFIESLYENHPGMDFGVTCANGNPHVVGVLNLNGDTTKVSYSRTSGGTSLGGFLLGGALFGTAGAIVGGMSGTQRTITNTNLVYSKELLVRIIYSNGRLWEGKVVKGSPLYNEIMVNMR